MVATAYVAYQRLRILAESYDHCTRLALDKHGGLSVQKIPKYKSNSIMSHIDLKISILIRSLTTHSFLYVLTRHLVRRHSGEILTPNSRRFAIIEL